MPFKIRRLLGLSGLEVDCCQKCAAHQLQCNFALGVIAVRNLQFTNWSYPHKQNCNREISVHPNFYANHRFATSSEEILRNLVDVQDHSVI